jgi:hypothetical protein
MMKQIQQLTKDQAGMGVSYELKVPTKGRSLIEKLGSRLEAMSTAGDIDILVRSLPRGDSLTASFRCGKWKEFAKREYLRTKEFESAIPIISSTLDDLATSVRRQLFEAAESEFLASCLIINVNADLTRVLFSSKYEDTMTNRQAEQVGFYLRTYLVSFLKDLIEYPELHPISVVID